MTDPRTLRHAPRILVLAGSSEASDIAGRLARRHDVTVISSFAGRVRDLTLPPGDVRVGGFGGATGLATWLRDENIAAVLDATHPFTANMPAHVAQACAEQGIARMRVLRPEWEAQAGDRWWPVADLEGAAATLETLGARRVFLTTGRQELAPFSRLTDTWFLVRSIESPSPMPLERAEILLRRGPFRLRDERDLLARYRIDCLVTKNSGGSSAHPKLVAAREANLPVVMVKRPTYVGARVATVDEALSWCASVLGLCGAV